MKRNRKEKDFISEFRQCVKPTGQAVYRVKSGSVVKMISYRVRGRQGFPFVLTYDNEQTYKK